MKQTKTVAKIRSAYLQQARASGHSLPLDIGLTVQNQPLRDDVSVSQLNFFKDRVIILQAHDTAGHSHLHDDFEDDLFDTKLAAASYYSDEDERPTADESESDDEDVRDVEEPGVHQQDQFTMYDRDHDASQSPTSTPFDSTYAAIIAKIADLERIEAIAKQGLGRLRPLEDCLRSSPRSADAPVFLQKITELRQQARYARTIIGVVGVTGSGKSSVLNAVLEEENILPTSGMRACTAVPVELSYNNTEDPSKKYRAVIEFIDSDDWKKELKLCLEAIKDDPRGVSAESESEAGMAYAKIKAVYPNVTKSMLANMTVEALLKQKHVQHHLGANRSITSPSPGPFFAGLQKFIDTVDDSATRKGPKQPEMWPLVKCVKIYLKARALSTGTTLVDLPGAQDSNAAREAVTDQYIRQCSGLWIVAPINRAVNDKTAKALLGEHFKRQMKLDGLLENVTFICTKSDDISIRETQASLDISDQLGEASSEWKRHKAAEEAIWDQIDVVDARIKELDDAYKAIRSEIRTWNALKKQHGQGREVFAPQPKSVKKRAPATKAAQSSPRKRLKQGESSNVRAIPTRNPFLDNDDDDSEEEDDTGRAQPLTEHDIATKIEDLKKQQVEAKEEGSKEYETRTTLDAQIENVQALILASKEKQKVICIAARNNWSRSRIRRDYALEIKELDQECAEKAGGDDFDPNKELRDYDALGASLPVFCVSSRAYQALCGRAKIDGQTAGFQAVDETEIPQLIAHCAKMTEMSRITTNRIFLRDLTDLLLSLSLWASDAGSGGRLSDAQREEQRRLLDRDLEKLKADLGNAITRAMKDLRVTIEKHILKALTRATQQAEFAAGSTADAWGASEDGLHWSTYRAVVKRDGAYTNRKGDTYDFNKDLSALFEKYFASGWEECFHRIIPKHLKSLGMGQGLNLNSFHELIAGRANTLGFGVARIQVLGQRLRIWKDRCAVQGDELIKTISDMQKGISRDIVPVIKKRMCPSYRANAHLKGKWSIIDLKIIFC